MRITINLASHPFIDLGPLLKRLRIAMAVLAALCLLCGFGLHLLGSQAAETRASERAIDAKIAQVQAERQADEATMHAPDNAQLLRQTEFLNQRFDEKAFSWTLAMEAMETVLPANVQLTSIEPARAKDGHITVHLRVVGPRDRTVELVRNLERSRRFLLPRIIGESAESGNSSGQRLEPISISNRFDFDLLADYNPPTPEERATAATPANLKGKRAVAAPAAQPVRQPYTGSARSQSPWSKPNPATPLHRQPGGQQ